MFICKSIAVVLKHNWIAGKFCVSSSKCSGPNSAATTVTKLISPMHKQSWIGPLKLIAASKRNCRDAGTRRSWNGGNVAEKQKRLALQEASTSINIEETKAETYQGNSTVRAEVTEINGDQTQISHWCHPNPSEELKPPCLAQVLTCYTYVTWTVSLFSSHTYSCYN